MEDRSIIEPVLHGLEYFYESEEELFYFYKVIDKFCALWFGKSISCSKFEALDHLLIHDLLAEYLRFEENSKRISLWLLAINRVCYNYTANLSDEIKEINEQKEKISGEFDNTLIKPILNNIKTFEEIHITSMRDDRGKSDIIGNLLQWIMVYTNYIYPSLDNKKDVYDKRIVQAMNYLLLEFLKHKSNDKRVALLILSIMEACRLYSINHQYTGNQAIAFPFEDNDIVVAGTEQELVEELLNRLRDENEKQKQSPMIKKEILTDDFVKNSLDILINNINNDPNDTISYFNSYIFKLNTKFLSCDKGNQFFLLQTLLKYKKKVRSEIPNEAYNHLKNSLSLLSSQSIKWFQKEAQEYDKLKERYIEKSITKIGSSDQKIKSNAVKSYIMLFLFKKFDLL